MLVSMIKKDSVFSDVNSRTRQLSIFTVFLIYIEMATQFRFGFRVTSVFYLNGRVRPSVSVLSFKTKSPTDRHTAPTESVFFGILGSKSMRPYQNDIIVRLFLNYYKVVQKFVRWIRTFAKTSVYVLILFCIEFKSMSPM